jgi:hypothetical protein
MSSMLLTSFFSMQALVHWGHPGNMLVVLLAMGGYGAVYLGWQIRLSEDGVRLRAVVLTFSSRVLTHASAAAGRGRDGQRHAPQGRVSPVLRWRCSPCGLMSLTDA